MGPVKERIPAVEGWFRMDDDDPRLLGSRCTSCGTFFFPRQSFACRNPDCAGRDLEEVALSRRGRLWSWTTNHYPPPAPYVAPEPFEPYTIAAVELDAEQMVVLGQMQPGVDPDALHVGDEVELTLGTLFSDGQHEYVVWQWRPVSAGPGADAGDGTGAGQGVSDNGGRP